MKRAIVSLLAVLLLASGSESQQRGRGSTRPTRPPRAKRPVKPTQPVSASAPEAKSDRCIRLTLQMPAKHTGDPLRLLPDPVQ